MAKDNIKKLLDDSTGKIESDHKEFEDQIKTSLKEFKNKTLSKI